MKIEKIEYMNGFKVVHRVPDVTEEEREQIKQEILLKLYNDFTRRTETNGEEHSDYIGRSSDKLIIAETWCGYSEEEEDELEL